MLQDQKDWSAGDRREDLASAYGWKPADFANRQNTVGKDPVVNPKSTEEGYMSRMHYTFVCGVSTN